MEKDGPLDGRKYNKSNNDSQMGQKKYFKKLTLGKPQSLVHVYFEG